MTDKEKIRAEIERRMFDDYNTNDEDNDAIAQGVCAGILSFIDSLPEEPAPKGYDEAYLNECIAKASKTWEGVDVDKFMDEVRGRESDDLEEAAREWAEAHYKDLVSQQVCADDFMAGAIWQKRKMMEGAVEAEVADFNGELYNRSVECGLTDLDKVKIIILKDDE